MPHGMLLTRLYIKIYASHSFERSTGNEQPHTTPPCVPTQTAHGNTTKAAKQPTPYTKMDF